VEYMQRERECPEISDNNIKSTFLFIKIQKSNAEAVIIFKSVFKSKLQNCSIARAVRHVEMLCYHRSNVMFITYYDTLSSTFYDKIYIHGINNRIYYNIFN